MIDTCVFREWITVLHINSMAMKNWKLNTRGLWTISHQVPIAAVWISPEPTPYFSTRTFSVISTKSSQQMSLERRKSETPQTWLDICVFLFRVGKTFIKIKQCFFVSLLVSLTRFSHSDYQISSDISSSVIWLICCWIKSTMTVVSRQCRYM